MANWKIYLVNQYKRSLLVHFPLLGWLKLLGTVWLLWYTSKAWVLRSNSRIRSVWHFQFYSDLTPIFFLHFQVTTTRWDFWWRKERIYVQVTNERQDILTNIVVSEASNERGSSGTKRDYQSLSIQFVIVNTHLWSLWLSSSPRDDQASLRVFSISSATCVSTSTNTVVAPATPVVAAPRPVAWRLMTSPLLALVPMRREAEKPVPRSSSSEKLNPPGPCVASSQPRILFARGRELSEERTEFE